MPPVADRPPEPDVVDLLLQQHARIEDRNRILEPYFAEIYRRATLQDIGLDRYAGDQPRWPGQNRPRPP